MSQNCLQKLPEVFRICSQNSDLQSETLTDFMCSPFFPFLAYNYNTYLLTKVIVRTRVVLQSAFACIPECMLKMGWPANSAYPCGFKILNELLESWIVNVIHQELKGFLDILLNNFRILENWYKNTKRPKLAYIGFCKLDSYLPVQGQRQWLQNSEHEWQTLHPPPHKHWSVPMTVFFFTSTRNEWIHVKISFKIDLLLPAQNGRNIHSLTSQGIRSKWHW